MGLDTVFRGHREVGELTQGIYKDSRSQDSGYEDLPGYRPSWAGRRKDSKRGVPPFWVWVALFMVLIVFGVLLTYLMTL